MSQTGLLYLAICRLSDHSSLSRRGLLLAAIDKMNSNNSRMVSPPLMLIEVDDNTLTILHYLFSEIVIN